jgi:hypothetical protein
MDHDFSTGTSTKVTIGATSTTVLAAYDARKYCVLCNDSDEEIYISFGTAAVLNCGIRLNRKGGIIEIAGDKPFRGAIYGICTTGGKNLAIYHA